MISKQNQSLLSPELEDRSRAIVNDGFFVKSADCYVKLKFADILWVKSDEDSSIIFFKCNKGFLCIKRPLGRVEKVLPPDMFVRINRSQNINIWEVDKFIGNTYFIGKEQLFATPSYSKGIRSTLHLLERETHKGCDH